MTDERKSPPDGTNASHPIALSPWLVAVAGLVLYGLTLNHWVTLSSLPFASQLTGWNWHPGTLPWRPSFQPPLLLVLTLPLRLLPAVWRPLGLNVFTAVCGALTLAILARSVRLLPQDRTKEQRLREGGAYAMISMRQAFLPVAFAVLMLALDGSFWQNATSGTGDMLDLLVFAFLILCLLEFRISQNESRLHLFSFVYGLGVANNWGLIGFFPCFLLAMVWIRRRSFFHWRFILQMTGWGVLGLLLYLLTPLLAVAAHDGSFWIFFRQEFVRQHALIKIFPKWVVLIVWAPVLLPLLFASINWPSSEGELNAGAHDLTRGLFRMIHIVFLGVMALVFFSVKFSPTPERMGLPGYLTFYYVAALNIGYFSGYVLLVFGKDVPYRWGQARGIFLLWNRTVSVLLWVAAVGLPVGLCFQNLSRIQVVNGDIVPQFARLLVQTLPGKPALVLGDDPIRLQLAAGEWQRQGKSDQYIFIDTESLAHREYLRYLTARFPQFKKSLVDPDTLPKVVESGQLADLLAHLSQRQPVYYLHPSAGYFFERAYMVPHGLGGDVHPYTLFTNAFLTISNALQLRTLAPDELQRNQEFWVGVDKGLPSSLPALTEVSGDAVRIANYFSESLDSWGVALQRTGTQLHNANFLKDAGDEFAEAFRLNPYNYMARFNMQYNARLRGLPLPAAAGPPISVSSLSARVSDWASILATEGLPDEPDLDTQIGQAMAMNRDFIQASQLFERCLQLRPGDPVAELDLAKTYIDLGLVDSGLSLVNQIREHSASVSDELIRVEALAYTKKGEFETADKLLLNELAKNPRNEDFVSVLIQFYRTMGYTALHKNNAAEAQKYFSKALGAIDDLLGLLNSPTTSSASTTGIPDAMLRRAEMQMMLNRYADATETLNHLVQLDPDNPLPRLNRAISELQASNFSAAKADYLVLEKSPTVDYRVYYGLADIARQQKDRDGEIHYSKLYLNYAPTETPEYTNITRQLQSLEGR